MAVKHTERLADTLPECVYIAPVDVGTRPRNHMTERLLSFACLLGWYERKQLRSEIENSCFEVQQRFF